MAALFVVADRIVGHRAGNKFTPEGPIPALSMQRGALCWASDVTQGFGMVSVPFLSVTSRRSRMGLPVKRAS